MNKKTLVLALSCAFVLIITVFSFSISSCTKDDGADDEDSITGIWYPAVTYNDSTLTPCARQCYYEFADYSLDSTRRTINYYYACTHDTLIDEEGDNAETITVSHTLPPFTSQYGYYTIKDSTLTIKLMNNATTVYTIRKINKQKMVLAQANRDGVITEYIYYRKQK